MWAWTWLDSDNEPLSPEEKYIVYVWGAIVSFFFYYKRAQLYKYTKMPFGFFASEHSDQGLMDDGNAVWWMSLWYLLK